MGQPHETVKLLQLRSPSRFTCPPGVLPLGTEERKGAGGTGRFLQGRKRGGAGMAEEAADLLAGSPVNVEVVHSLEIAPALLLP